MSRIFRELEGERRKVEKITRMGDTWVDPLQYVRGFSAQDGTLMDVGRQLVHKGSGETGWSGSGLGNWQSSRSNGMVGELNFAAAEDPAVSSFETGSFFGGGSTRLSDNTNPRPYQATGMKQQHMREPVNCYAGVQNVEIAKPRVMISSVLDACVSPRDQGYCMDYALTGEADVKYHQLERELVFRRREAEGRVWRNNFEAISQVRMSTGPNAIVSAEQSLSNGYGSSRGMSPIHSHTSQHKSGIDYNSSISARGVNSGQSHMVMVPSSRGAELASPNVTYGSGEAVVGLNCISSARQNTNSGMGYSGRTLETPSTGYGSQACDVESDITSVVVPSLSYEMPDFHSASFSYSTPIYEERVATNDSSGEPMDCLMGEFQPAVVPDAMSPAVAPIFKRSSWEIVNDGFDLLSHGSCPDTSGGFPWQSDILVGDIGHNSFHNSTPSFMLPNTPRLSSAGELSSANILDSQTGQEFSLVPSVLSVQQNLPSSNTGISCELQREGGSSEVVSSQREGSGSETISTQTEVGSREPISAHGGRKSADRGREVKEESMQEGAVEPIADCEREPGTGDKMERVMRMMTRVMRLAEAVDSNDSEACDSALAAVQEFCAVDGDYTQRVAHYFCEALSVRRASECGKAGISEEPYPLPHDLLEDCKFTEASPYTKFVHLTANQALLEAVEGADSVHIIDIGTMQGVQWSALLQALVVPAGSKAAASPRKIRISGIASPKLGSNACDSLLRTGRRLTEFAEVLGLQIEFNPILDEVQNLDPDSFQIREDEVVAVNFMLQLHQHIGEEDGERVTKIVKLVQNLKPKVVVLVEYEAAVNTETSDSQTRLLDAMKHYSAIFHSLEVLPRDCSERTRIERDILGREIRKMFSTTSDKGAMKHASFAQWKDLFTRLGFQVVKPSHYSFSQARLLLWMYEGPYQILNNPQSLSLSWQDRVVITVSAWNCP